MKRSIFPVITGLLVMVFAFSCGPDKAQQAQISDLRMQISELNRHYNDAQVRIEELNNRLFLLQDKVETCQLNPVRETPPSDLKVVKLLPDRTAEASAVKPSAPVAKTGGEGKEPVLISNWPKGSSASSLPPSAGAAKAIAIGKLRQDYEHALSLFQEKRYNECIDAFSRFLKEHGENDYSDNAMYWTGVAFYEQREFDQAMIEFKKVLAHPRTNKGPDAMHYLALCHQRKGEKDAARALWQDLIRKHPGSDAAQKATEELKGMAN